MTQPSDDRETRVALKVSDERAEMLELLIRSIKAGAVVDDYGAIVDEAENLLSDRATLLARVAELEGEVRDSNRCRDTYKQLYNHALDCVDQVFQRSSEIPNPLLPDFAHIGEDKFRAVVRLAKEHIDLTAQLRAAELKASHSLANNLCSDHRDKQKGKPCLACTAETLERKLATEERLANQQSAAISDVFDFIRRHTGQEFEDAHTAALHTGLDFVADKLATLTQQAAALAEEVEGELREIDTLMGIERDDDGSFVIHVVGDNPAFFQGGTRAECLGQMNAAEADLAAELERVKGEQAALKQPPRISPKVAKIYETIPTEAHEPDCPCGMCKLIRKAFPTSTPAEK